METLLLLFCFKTRDEMITLFTPLPFLLTCSQSSMHSQVYITTLRTAVLTLSLKTEFPLEIYFDDDHQLNFMYFHIHMHGDYAALVKDQ